MFASHNFNALFSIFSSITSLGEDDDLLVYTREDELPYSNSSSYYPLSHYCKSIHVRSNGQPLGSC